MISLLHQTPNCRSRLVPTPQGHPVHRSVRQAALGAVVLSLIALVGLTACSDLSVPVLRSRAADPPPLEPATGDGTGTTSADRTAAECAQLRSEIRANQQAVREAPTISTSPEIVAAAEAKADKRIDDTRSQLDELDCPSEPDTGEKLRPLAPLPAAPGMPSAPGAASP